MSQNSSEAQSRPVTPFPQHPSSPADHDDVLLGLSTNTATGGGNQHIFLLSVKSLFELLIWSLYFGKKGEKDSFSQMNFFIFVFRIRNSTQEQQKYGSK